MTMRKLRNILFIGFLLTGAVTYFTRHSLRTVDAIRPETLVEPLQTALSTAPPIEFTRNGYRYEVTPRFDYRISGLIVRKMDYGWFVIDRAQKAFSVDLCLLWGDNLRRKVHQDSTIRFSQDCRWCWAQWHGDLAFNLQQMSNNHLLPADDRVEAKIKSLQTGDQVSLRGKLINVTACLFDKGGRYDSGAITWNTSTTRDDTGAGACEVIYVEDVEVLQPANLASRYVFRASVWGLVAVALYSLVDFFRPGQS
jgi:hypothetical protein